MYAYKHLTMLYVNDIHIIDSWKWNQSYKFNLNRFLFFLVACFIIYFSPMRGKSFVCFCLSPWIDQLKGGVPLGFPVCSRHPLTCKLKSICRDYSGALSLSGRCCCNPPSVHSQCLSLPRLAFLLPVRVHVLPDVDIDAAVVAAAAAVSCVGRVIRHAWWILAASTASPSFGIAKSELPKWLMTFQVTFSVAASPSGSNLAAN